MGKPRSSRTASKNRATHALTIRVSLVPGRCRWCGCTYYEPCANGCGWANREQTLCTECVPLDKGLRTFEGRRELAEFLQEAEFLALLGPSASTNAVRLSKGKPGVTSRVKASSSSSS
jgi:hypothetical protein